MTPGKKLRLQIELPALHQIQGNLGPSDGRVRVVCDGISVLDVVAHYYVREPDRLFFGENTLGGTACGKTLRGQITNATGAVLRGAVGNHYSWRERLSDWCRRLPHEGLVLLLFSIGIGYLSGRTASLRAWTTSAITWIRKNRDGNFPRPRSWSATSSPPCSPRI